MRYLVTKLPVIWYIELNVFIETSHKMYTVIHNANYLMLGSIIQQLLVRVAGKVDHIPLTFLTNNWGHVLCHFLPGDEKQGKSFSVLKGKEEPQNPQYQY